MLQLSNYQIFETPESTLTEIDFTLNLIGKKIAIFSNYVFSHQYTKLLHGPLNFYVTK